jgi:hypothetical protein
LHVLVLEHVCPKLLVDPQVPPFAKQMKVQFAQGGQKRVGIAEGELRPVRPGHLEPVGQHVFCAGQFDLKQPARIHLIHCLRPLALHQ